MGCLNSKPGKVVDPSDADHITLMTSTNPVIPASKPVEQTVLTGSSSRPPTPVKERSRTTSYSALSDTPSKVDDPPPDLASDAEGQVSALHDTEQPEVTGSFDESEDDEEDDQFSPVPDVRRSLHHIELTSPEDDDRIMVQREVSISKLQVEVDSDDEVEVADLGERFSFNGKNEQL